MILHIQLLLYQILLYRLTKEYAVNFFKKFICYLWQSIDHLKDILLFSGCDFAGWVTQEEAGFTPQQGNQYQPSTNALPRVLRQFSITETDNIIDVGCGKGKAMTLMRRFPFGKVSGFDLSKPLVEIANRNFSHLKLKNCQAFYADAAGFTKYDDFNYIYFYNSLPEAIFKKAIANLEESLSRNPRRCILIYLNPVYHDYLINNTSFHQIRIQKSWISWFTYICYEFSPNNQQV